MQVVQLLIILIVHLLAIGNLFVLGEIEIKDILNGGSVVNPSEFPWLVGLLDQSLGVGIGKLFCGGSILGPNHVLTSGRCVTKWISENGSFVLMDPRIVRVIAGDLSRMDDEETEQVVDVEEIFLNSMFRYDGLYKNQKPEPSQSKKGFENDLAILKITPSFNITANVKPIKLISNHNFVQHELDVAGSPVELEFEPDISISIALAGWGITDKKQNTIPTGVLLKKVQIPLNPNNKDNKKNQKKFGFYLQGDSSNLEFDSGIGSNKGLMGRCLGDPGGALVISDSEEDFLCGVISFGIWCDRYLPSGQAFLLNEYQLDWIKSVIDPRFWTYFAITGMVTMTFAAVAIVLVKMYGQFGFRFRRRNNPCRI